MENIFGLETINLRKKLLIDGEEFKLEIKLTKEKNIYMASLYKGDEYLKSYSPFMDKIEYSDLLDFSYKFIALYFKKEREKQDSLYVFENWNGIINKKVY